MTIRTRLAAPHVPITMIGCPACARVLKVGVDGIPPDDPFPLGFTIQCFCGHRLDIQLDGWALNPTGETPAAESATYADVITTLSTLLP